MGDNTTNLTIRFLADVDVPKISTFFEGLSEASRSFYHPYAFDQGAVANIAKELRSSSCVHIGAFSDGKLVGHVWSRGRGEDGYPGLGVAVIDAFHNRGIGQKLMQQIEDIARERGEQGLALTCYRDNYRAIRVYAKQGYRLVGRTGDDAQFRMVRNFADDDTPYITRGVYASSIPWNIAPLTTDTWSLDDWKWYIELLNVAGCNLLKLYIWPTQYYHPDEPGLGSNAWRYQVWHDALAYARVMGMETHVGFSSGTVPPSTWLRYPELRAEDVNYTGITLCWQRGKDRILPYQEYLIETFADVADSFVLWFADPGACICSECRDYLRVMLDGLHTLSAIVDGRAAITACPWWIENIEAGKSGFAPHPNLRCRIASELPEGSKVIIRSVEYETIDIMREGGLVPLPLAFFLDPEGGFESNNILPEPKLQQIDTWLERGLEEKHTASLAYRLTPYTQYPGDFYFFRKQLNPAQSRDSILTDLGEYICNPYQREEVQDDGMHFASAVESLDQWWSNQREQDLADAMARLNALRERHDSVRNLADGATLLHRLSQGLGDQVLEAFTENLRLQMSPMPIFRGLTLDYLWSGRAHAFLQLRIENWLKRLQP